MRATEGAERIARPSWRRRLRRYAAQHTLDDLLTWVVIFVLAAAAIYFFFW